MYDVVVSNRIKLLECLTLETLNLLDLACYINKQKKNNNNNKIQTCYKKVEVIFI